MLANIWAHDRRGVVRIFLLHVISSLTDGIGIVMLVPMMGLLDLSQGASGALGRLFAPFQAISDQGRAVVLIGVYLLLVVARAFLGRAASVQGTRFVEGHHLRLRGALYRAINSADWEALAASKRTDLIDLFTTQCERVSYAVSQIIQLMASGVSAAVQLGIALWMSVPLTLLVLLAGACFLPLSRPFLKKSRHYGGELTRIYQAFFSELSDQLSSIKEIRAYGIEDEQAQRFERVSRQFFTANVRFAKLRATPQILFSTAAAALIAAIFLLSFLVLHTDIARLAVMVYVFGRLWPLLSSGQARLQAILADVPAQEELARAMANMAAYHREEPAGEGAMPLRERVSFEQVSFTYRGAQTPALRDVSFSLARGSVTALVGRSGAGKSTVADLLMGLLQPSAGSVRIDGVPLTRENARAWRRSVGYVPQDPLLLNASIRENLARFHPGASEAEMIRALERSLAWDFVQKLPQGLDTMLGDRGLRLSGGERQRIVLARVLMGAPQLIVLDEATSALDYQSEGAIRDTIASLRSEVTLLIVAHRLATIRSAEYAVVLEEGAVAERGALRTLLATPGSYLSRMISVE